MVAYLLLDQLKLVWKIKVTSHNIFVFSCLSSEMWETLKCFVESRKNKTTQIGKTLKLGFTHSPEFGTWF